MRGFLGAEACAQAVVEKNQQRRAVMSELFETIPVVFHC